MYKISKKIENRNIATNFCKVIKMQIFRDFEYLSAQKTNFRAFKDKIINIFEKFEKFSTYSYDQLFFSLNDKKYILKAKSS